MIIDNFHILPICQRNEPYPQMMQAMFDLTNNYTHLPYVEARTDLGLIKIDFDKKAVFLKQRRYDVIDEAAWRIECGSMIACLQELGFTFYYEPGISN